MLTFKPGEALIVCAVAVIASLFTGFAQALHEPCDEEAYFPEYVEIVHGCPTELPASWKAVLEATIPDHDVFYIMSGDCHLSCGEEIGHYRPHGAKLHVKLSAGEWIVSYQGFPDQRITINEESTELDRGGILHIRFEGSGACDERNFIDRIYEIADRVIANCDTVLELVFSDYFPVMFQIFVWQAQEWEPIS